MGGFEAEHQPWHGRPYSLVLTVAPLAVTFFEGRPPDAAKADG
jgi:hypothetical protein